MPWAADTGGSITLREPLTLQQLQGGGLILSVKVDGNDPIDIPCTVGMQETQVREIIFEYDNRSVFYVNNYEDYASGVFQLYTSGDHTHTYQVVNVKIVREALAEISNNDKQWLINELGMYVNMYRNGNWYPMNKAFDGVQDYWTYSDSLTPVDYDSKGSINLVSGFSTINYGNYTMSYMGNGYSITPDVPVKAT